MHASVIPSARALGLDLPCSSECGMTLLELVVVLIVIGALASFAVPKFTDYSGLAMGRVAESVRIEAQMQIDAAFGTALRRGYPCEEASATSAVLSSVLKKGKDGGFAVGIFEIRAEDPVVKSKEEGGTPIRVVSEDGRSWEAGRLYAGYCFSMPEAPTVRLPDVEVPTQPVP